MSSLTKRKVNPILVILIAAVVLVIITALVVLIMGGRFTTLDNGAKFLGKSESGQPVSGTIKYQNGTKALLDYYNRTITYDNGDVYEGEIVGGCRHGYGVISFSATGDVYEGYFQNDEITTVANNNGKFKY